MHDDIAAKAMGHVERLSVDIGPRAVGSPGNRAAADYIESILRSAGLAVDRQWFPCADWGHEDTALELDGCRLKGAANWFSPSCDVVGPPVPVASLNALEHADLTGRIGILYGELTRETLTPKRFTVYNPERHQRTVQLLENKRPAAIITVNPTTHSLDRVIKDFDLDIPSATVPPEVGLELLRNADRPLRLRIATTRSAGHSCNVVGRSLGTRAERVVVCAHYDTVWDTPGAIDNASGVGVMLALAQALAERALETGLEFLAMGGEDCCGQGDELYLRLHGLQFLSPQSLRRSHELDSVLAVINADGVGQELGPNTMTTMGGSPRFDEMVESIRREGYPDILHVDPWYASDHSAFYAHGVPCIPLNSVGVVDVAHRPSDTIDWISPKRLAELVLLTADIVDGLQDKTPDWCRPTEPTAS